VFKIVTECTDCILYLNSFSAIGR